MEDRSQDEMSGEHPGPRLRRHGQAHRARCACYNIKWAATLVIRSSECLGWSIEIAKCEDGSNTQLDVEYCNWVN